MELTSRAAKLALAVATGLALTLAVSPSTASAAGSTSSAAAAVSAEATGAVNASQATWHLSDYEQRACLPANVSNFTYFVGFVAGSWSTPLYVDMHGLPAGTVTSLPHPPIPPGSNGDRYVGIAWVSMTLPPLTFGEYRAEMTLTDGVVTQTMPIVIKIQERWGCGL
ncbi:DUF5980 family protein [Solwaraspora sp. WMMB335]|uniref:DUF5980 family protein n=1 Tax=Solwaraspora sp. WMMB335 TaxID=3404118 RepID=UPI003B966515